MKEKILFFRPDHIGDLLLTTPAICSFKNSFPDIHSTVAVGSWSADVIKNNPYINERIIIDLPWLSRGNTATYFRLLKQCIEIRKTCFDHIFSFRIAAKSAFVSLLLGGRKRWGFKVNKSGWAFTEKIPYNPKKHVVENYLDIIETFGADRGRNNGMEIFISDEERTHFDAVFSLPEKYVVISPGAGYLPKLWISERWAAVADLLNFEYNLPVVITGTKSEELISRDIESQMRAKLLNLCGCISLRELAVLIERSCLLITVDSAAMHIASAVNTPQIALFGFTNPVQWGPYPERDSSIVLFKPLKKTLSSDNIKQIYVEDVKNSIEKLQSLKLL